MSDNEQDKFQTELRRIKPAVPPETLTARLRTEKPPAKASWMEVSRSGTRPPQLLWWLRWLIPATAAVVVAAAIWRGGSPSTSRPPIPAASSEINAALDSPALRADDVQIGQELVSSFDAVARLPGGEPVRFQFQQWMDEVILSDTSQGLVVESRSPRFEVVPVGFETY